MSKYPLNSGAILFTKFSTNDIAEIHPAMSSLHKILNKLNHQLDHNIITKSYYNKTTTIPMQYAGI